MHPSDVPKIDRLQKLPSLLNTLHFWSTNALIEDIMTITLENVNSAHVASLGCFTSVGLKICFVTSNKVMSTEMNAIQLQKDDQVRTLQNDKYELT